MLIKKETEYAILGLLALSKEGSEDFFDVKILAKEQNLSETLLSKIFQKLVIVNIVESKVGPGGGFRLAKSPKEINLWEIFSAVQVPNVLKCYSGKAPYCLKKPCPLNHTLLKIENFLKEYLTNTTLFELINIKEK